MFSTISTIPDLHNFFTSSSKDEMVENMQGVSFSSISRRPLTSSRVPLSTLSISSDNVAVATSIGSSNTTSSGVGAFALKLPGSRHHSEPVLANSPSPRSSRKQNLGWKKPRMRKSWSEFRSFIAEPLEEKTRGVAPLPELAWANRQEMWDLMVKKETGMYRRLAPDALLSRHTALQPRMRAILLDWLIEVCEVYRLHRETFYLAVDFIDRFLSVSPSVPKNRLQLIGVSCLFIGAKIEEIYPPKLQEFAYVTDGACTEEEILNMELMILKGLNWGLSPMTPNAWMRMYLQILHGSKIPNDDSFSLPAYSFALRERSPLQPKSFHGIQPDDAHHLQTHSIDLQLLERAQEQQQALCANVLRESPDPMAQAALAPTGLDNTPQEGEGDIMYPSTTVSSTCSTTPVSSGISNMPNSALMSPPLDSDIW